LPRRCAPRNDPGTEGVGGDHGATVLWNWSLPPLTAMMVAGLEALRF
jgi:hypothetical protein